MIKKVFSLAIFCSLCFSAIAIEKIAVVDIQKIVNKSAQVQALKKEQTAKRKELVQFVNKAKEDIKKQTDPAKKQELVKKYDKELAAKREANAKQYRQKLAAIDKSITSSIVAQAKAMGYDMVIAKGVVLYGGDDITDEISKSIK